MTVGRRVTVSAWLIPSWKPCTGSHVLCSGSTVGCSSLRQLCLQGLDYLHYNKVLHGDLKPANLLRSSDGLVKIADFGSALVYSEDEGMFEGAVNGTPAFRAPETLTAACKLTRKVGGVLGACLLACMHVLGTKPGESVVPAHVPLVGTGVCQHAKPAEPLCDLGTPFRHTQSLTVLTTQHCAP